MSRTRRYEMSGWFLLLAGALLVAGACHMTSALAIVPSASVSQPDRIVIPVSVSDAASVCVAPTAAMLFDHPLDTGPLCGPTVGQLRALVRDYHAQAN